MSNADSAPLIFAHIGDPHIEAADPKALTNFRSIAAEIRQVLGPIDFVVLPGDIANNGKAEEYAWVASVLALLPAVHVISGDHDMDEGSLANFYESMGVPRLPYAVDYGDVRCLFLDMCGPGRGGPDFRLGASQIEWLVAELKRPDIQRFAVFMHTYPEDIVDPLERAATIRLLSDPRVLLVDMGHTHYNELANDGAKIYAASRSTGQIEEDGGKVGYAIVAIDGRVVSWRFRRLGERKPLVLITAPADRRLAIDPRDSDHLPDATCHVRATVLSRRTIRSCTCSLDGAEPHSMTTADNRQFSAGVPLAPAGGRRTIVVEATDDSGMIGWEAIELANENDFRQHRAANGSDADRVGRWIERGIHGSQLGPNRNGKHW